MVVLTYLELLQEFDRWQTTRRLGASEIALWFGLARIWNNAGRPIVLSVPSVNLELKSGLSKMGVFRARKKLVDHGLIECKKGEGNKKAPVYRILTPWNVGNKVSNEVSNKSEVGNKVSNGVSNEVSNGVSNKSESRYQSKYHSKYHSDNLYRVRERDIHNIFNSDVEPTKKTNRFKIPTLEEIKNFIQENNYQVDAERFFDYYESNGWTIGRNKPMKNWQAAIRNWNRNSYSNTGYSDEVSKSKETEPEKKVMINSYEEMPF